MSLEAKIEELTKAIHALTEQMQNGAVPAVEQPREPQEPEQLDEQSDDTPSVEDLQALAMTIVRKDRSKKNAIKDLIASFGGAKVIGDVPADKLPELAEKMGAL
jgi:hypothetical protein